MRSQAQRQWEKLIIRAEDMWGRGPVSAYVHNLLRSQKKTANLEGVFYIQTGRSQWVHNCSRFSCNEYQVKEFDEKIKTEQTGAVAREHWRYLQHRPSLIEPSEAVNRRSCTCSCKTGSPWMHTSEHAQLKIITSSEKKNAINASRPKLHCYNMKVTRDHWKECQSLILRPWLVLF